MNTAHGGDHRLVVAVFDDQKGVHRALEALVRDEFPLDSLSLLGRGESSGDDLLGVYYHGPGERIRAWAAQGAFWGAIWGLLSGAAGMFVVPGLGALFAVGPIVNALAGAATGAAVAGGAMAGAAALGQLAVALHRLGIPEQALAACHDAIERGHYLLILRVQGADEAERWAGVLRRHAPASIEVHRLVA